MALGGEGGKGEGGRESEVVGLELQRHVCRNVALTVSVGAMGLEPG